MRSPRRTLAAAILPGDSIIVRCGGLTHQAVVWKIDAANNRVLMLDPFY